MTPFLTSQLWLLDSLIHFYMRVFLADSYKTSRDVGGWLDCAFYSRPGMSESHSGYPTEKASDKPFLHPTKSLKATRKCQKIDGSPSSQGIWNVEPFFLLLNSWEEKEVRAKWKKQSGMRAFSVRSLSHSWKCLSWRSGCKDSKRRAEGLTKMHSSLSFYLMH